MPTEAVPALRARAEQGSADAQYNLGSSYATSPSPNIDSPVLSMMRCSRLSRPTGNGTAGEGTTP